uniref:Uncharacterized protein n=1 Tax=Manihot esculenta TaxID=3983 RepID=A0A2C9WF19_MANES
MRTESCLSPLFSLYLIFTVPIAFFRSFLHVSSKEIIFSLSLKLHKLILISNKLLQELEFLHVSSQIWRLHITFKALAFPI